MTIRVLIIEDSRIFQRLIQLALSADPEIEVIGCAGDPYEARELIIQHEPDVLTLDINLPRMNGLEFLKRLMRHKAIPTIVFSSLTYEGSQEAMDAFALGAVEVLPKPASENHFKDTRRELSRAVHAAAIARLNPNTRPPSAVRCSIPSVPSTKSVFSRDSLIAIGASTGGTEAIKNVLTRLPSDAPCTLIVQHMPASFTKSFAERLDSLSAMKVSEAQGGEILQAGHAYVAPGGSHMIIEKYAEGYRTVLTRTDKIHYQRPAVDALFNSIAQLYHGHIAATVLTGMGRDGADGLLALQKRGAHCCHQNEASSVVYGMPKAACANGASSHSLDIHAVAEHLIHTLSAPPNTRPVR